MNNLTPEMQARLDNWKSNILPVKGASILKRKSPGNFVPRQRDYGDDISDYEKKQAEAWSNETTNRGYV